MKVWTKDQCIAKLMAEKAAGTTYDELWERLKNWHIQQYCRRGAGRARWADDCLEIFDKTQRKLFPEDCKRGDAEFAKLVMDGKEVYANYNHS